MPAIVYDEDLFEIDLDEDDIRACSDQETLIGWLDDTDATIEDIKAQIAACALGGVAERAWVYRAAKASGFMARANSRIRARLVALGWTPPKAKRDLAEAEAKFATYAARNAVAIEFLRLCTEGALQDRALFHRIEAHAARLVQERELKRGEKSRAFAGKAAA